MYQGDVGVAPFFQKAWALMADAWWFPSLLEEPQHSHELVKMPMAVHEQRANALWIFAQRQAAAPNAARLAQAFPDTAPPTHATQSSDQGAVGLPCWRDCRRAFLALYKELLPDLSATAWPEGGAWAHVSRQWPSAPDMLVQYKEVRAMVQKRAQREADWFAVDRVILCAWHPIVHAILLRARSEPRPAC